MSHGNRIVIGADNGIDGALCAVSSLGGLIAYSRMPTLKRAGKEEIDICGVRAWCSTFGDNFVFAPEEPLKFARTSQAMRSMALGYGKLLALAHLHYWDLRETGVKEWQTKMLGKKVPKGQTKSRALAVARELEPNETWIPPRCRTPHDGVVDAYLIARFVALGK